MPSVGRQIITVRYGNEDEPDHRRGGADSPGSVNPGDAVRVERKTSCKTARPGGGRHQGACPIPRLAQCRACSSTA